MRIQRLFIPLIILLCFFAVQSCKKSDGPTPDPTPVVMPDTLGVGWTKKIISGENLGDVFFNSATTGFLTGNQIYKSTDGGSSWLSVLSNGGAVNIFMTNDGKAFFTDFASRVIKTIDGGNNFVNASIVGQASDVFFIDNLTGYCVTRENFVYNSIDAGLTWTKIITTGLPLGSGYSSISCINNSTGLIANDAGIYKTAGSFANWQQATISGGTNSNFFSLYAVSASIIYAANTHAEIFKSVDGGANFSFIKKVGVDGYTDVHFITDQEGYVSSGRHIFKTTDGGLNWTTVVSLGEGGIVELHFSDANHGWACGGNTVLTFKQ